MSRYIRWCLARSSDPVYIDLDSFEAGLATKDNVQNQLQVQSGENFVKDSDLANMCR